MAKIYRYMDVMIASHFIVGDHNVDVSIDLGHSVYQEALIFLFILSSEGPDGCSPMVVSTVVA